MICSIETAIFIDAAVNVRVLCTSPFWFTITVWCWLFCKAGDIFKLEALVADVEHVLSVRVHVWWWLVDEDSDIDIDFIRMLRIHVFQFDLFIVIFIIIAFWFLSASQCVYCTSTCVIMPFILETYRTRNAQTPIFSAKKNLSCKVICFWRVEKLIDQSRTWFKKSKDIVWFRRYRKFR